MTAYKERFKKELKVDGAPLKKAIKIGLPSPSPYDDLK